MLLIKNGYVKTMVGEDIPCGEVLIGDDGKIVAVGQNITAPDNAKVIDAEGRIVSPGLVEGHCHIGFGNKIAGADTNEKTNPITPEMRAIDAINPQDDNFPLALKGGITTVCSGPGSANIIGGTFAAIKCYGKRIDNMIVKYPLAMKCAFGENPKKVYGGAGKMPATRMGIAAMFREFLFRAKSYYEDKISGNPQKFDMKLEAMLPVMAGEIPLKAHAHRADDIFTAIRIAKEFGLKMTLDHCTDGSLIADELAKEGYPAFVGPTMNRPSKFELLNKTFGTPKDLYDAGVKFAITTDASVTEIDYLPMCAGMAVASGLDEDVAWRAVTINPAEINGISDRVGSLEAGKDGDVVIWGANPITTIGATSYITIVDGKVVYSAC